MGLFEKLTSKAKQNRQRIVLPEGTEPRTLTAADRLIVEELADIILIGNPAEIKAAAAELGLTNISKAKIVNPADEKVLNKYAPIFYGSHMRMLSPSRQVLSSQQTNGAHLQTSLFPLCRSVTFPCLS